MAIVDVVFVAFEDLDGRVLRVNLSFDERLKDFWNPDIKTDLAARRDDFERKVFLDAAGVFKLVFVAQNSVKRGKKLFGGKFFFVVRARNFEHQKDGVDVKNF